MDSFTKTEAHTDLTRFYGTAGEIYAHLKDDQERDRKLHQIAKVSLAILVGFSAVAFTSGWALAPWLAAGALLAFERTMWWGRELSNRNYTMHILTFMQMKDADR